MFLLHLPTTFPTCLQEIPKSINWVATIKYKKPGSKTGGQEKGRQNHGGFDFRHITEVVSSSEKVTPIKSYKKSLRILTKIQVVLCMLKCSVQCAGVGSSGVLISAVE